MDARATNAAAIREQCGRKLKAWVSYKIAICMFPNLNAWTRMDFGSFTLICNLKGGVHHIERRQGIIIKNNYKGKKKEMKIEECYSETKKRTLRNYLSFIVLNLYFLFSLELFGCIPRSIYLCLFFSSRLWTKFTCGWMINNPMGSWLFFYVVMVIL